MSGPNHESIHGGLYKKETPQKLGTHTGTCDVGDDDGNVIKLSPIIAVSSILGSSGEWSLAVLILCSLACEGSYLLCRHLRPQASSDRMNHNSCHLIVIQVVKQSIRARNYNIPRCNRDSKYLDHKIDPKS